jgi:hypothetical protein
MTGKHANFGGFPKYKELFHFSLKMMQLILFPHVQTPQMSILIKTKVTQVSLIHLTRRKS